MLISNFFLGSVTIFANETTDSPNSSLELSIEEKKEFLISEKKQEVLVEIKDTSSLNVDLAELNKPVYTIWFPIGVRYITTNENLSVETYQDHITFKLPDTDVKQFIFTFQVDSKGSTEPMIMWATRREGSTDLRSNDLKLIIMENDSEEMKVKDSELNSKEQSSEDSKKENKYSSDSTIEDTLNNFHVSENEQTSNEEDKSVGQKRDSRSIQSNATLENNMQVDYDFDEGITVEEYLAQNTFPHLPKGGVTTSYQSNEIDLRLFSSSEIALVHDHASWNEAIANPSIKVISVIKSFAMIAAQNNFNGANRKLVIEGNGLLIDFRLTISNFTGANNQITVQNLNMYHANYYGAIRPTANTSLLKFHNINDYGSQIISSQTLPIKISGDFISRFTTARYTSPIDGTNVATQYLGQQNFESSNIEFLSDSVTTLETHSGANIDLTAAGDVILYENAKLNLIAGRQANRDGEGYSGYGISARYSSNFIMKKNSKISYSYTDSGNGYRNSNGIVFFYNSGTFTMEDGAKMTVNKNSHSGNNGLIHFNLGGTFNLRNSSVIDINVEDASAGTVAVFLRSYGTNYPVFNMTGKSQMNVNLTSTGSGVNPVIDAGSYATFNIDTGSILDIQTNGYKGNIVNLGAGNATIKTLFTVGERATLNINSQGRIGTTTDVVNVGNYATFQISRLGTFKLSANIARYLFNVGANSIFQFSDALLVDFGYTQEPSSSSALINMAGNTGKFLVDIQRVKAWQRSDVILDDNKPDFDWNPMFGVEIPYSTTTVNNASIVGNSTAAGVADSFKENFNTGTTNGFQRLLFEFIPDVKVTIDNQPEDNINNINSKVISGQTNPGAYVRLSDTPVSGGYSSFPTSNNIIPDPTVDGNQPNYTVKADSTGYFHFEVPTNENIPFVAGTTIHAYSFLNGKSDCTDPIGSSDIPENEWDKVVDDTTAPFAIGVEKSFVKGEQLPEAKAFLKDIFDTNPNTDVTAYYNDTEEILNKYLNTVGDYDIIIILADGVGNTTEIKTKIHVFDAVGKINGKDIELKASQISSMSREDFENRMKMDIQATAYILINHQYKNLDNKIAYDFSKVNQNPGVYLVNLKVPKSESDGDEIPDKIVTVTIKASGPTEPADPDDPKEGNKPPEGTENSGTNAVGDLRMDYAPSSIMFGTVLFSYYEETYHALKPQNTSGIEMSKQWIQVSDDRTKLNGWTVKVSQSEAFTDSQGNKILGTILKIPKGTINNSIEGTVDINPINSKMSARAVELSVGDTSTLFGAKDIGEASSGKKISTYQWNPTKVTLTVPGGKTKTNITYETELNWSLVSEPTQ